MKKYWTVCCIGIVLSAAVSAQPPQRPGPPPGKEERLKHVSERINRQIQLSPAQKTKVEAAYRSFFDAMEKLRPAGEPGNPPPPPPPPPPGKKQEVDKLVKTRDARIKAALTAEQYRKYELLEREMRPSPRP